MRWPGSKPKSPTRCCPPLEAFDAMDSSETKPPGLAVRALKAFGYVFRLLVHLAIALVGLILVYVLFPTNLGNRPIGSITLNEIFGALIGAGVAFALVWFAIRGLFADEDVALRDWALAGLITALAVACILAFA